jgi:hypothetical protein
MYRIMLDALIGITDPTNLTGYRHGPSNCLIRYTNSFSNLLHITYRITYVYWAKGFWIIRPNAEL